MLLDVISRLICCMRHPGHSARSYANRTSYRARDLRGDLHVFLHTVVCHTAPRTRSAALFALSLRRL